MKLFLQNIGLFLTGPLLLLLAGWVSLRYLNQHTLTHYPLRTGVTTLVMGDSHAELSCDDRQWPTATNLGINSESYLYTYYKLESLLAGNPLIKQVYLTYGYHNLSGDFDEAIAGRYAKDVGARYFYLLPYEVEINILANNKKDLLLLLRNSVLAGIDNTVSPVKPFLGGYTNKHYVSTALPAVVHERIKQLYFRNGQLQPFSESNIFYLHRIASLCKTRNVQLVLLSTPVHSTYKAKVPTAYKHKYCEAAQGLALLDLTNLPLTDSCFMPDGDHVSARGAALTTAALQKFNAETTGGE